MVPSTSHKNLPLALFLLCSFLFSFFYSPPPDVPGSPPIFILLIFIPLILFCFLFHCDLFALTIGWSSTTCCPRVSTIFIPLFCSSVTFLHLHLYGFPPPDVPGSLPIFILLFLIHFLF